MNAEYHAEFRRASGERVVRTESCYWFESQSRVFNAFPSHLTFEPAPDEFKHVFHETDALFLRYPCPMHAPGVDSFRMVCTEKPYSLEILSGNSRSKIRRGLKHFTIDHIDFDMLARDGLGPLVSTLQRQGRKVPTTLQQDWERRCEAAKRTPGVFAWGAFTGTGSELVAFLLAYQIDDCMYLSVIRSKREYLNQYPNNALVYSVMKEVLARSDVREVSYGLEPMRQDIGSLDKFKTSMGFRKEPVRQRVVVHLLVRPLMGRIGRKFVATIVRRNPESDFWRRVEGIFHYYIG